MQKAEERLGLPEDKDGFLAAAQKLLEKASTTKAEACLTVELTGKASLADTRAQVQGEVRELRENIKPKKEQQVLHGAMVSRVKAALAMQAGDKV